MGFDRIVEFTLKWEGGYSDDSSDPGGETRYGISQRAYPKEDVKNLTLERAKELYKRDYWDKVAKGEYDVLDMCAFDTCVHCGVSRARRWLKWCKSWHELLDIRRSHYHNLAIQKPAMRKYLKGWLNRCNDLEKFLCN